MLAHVFNVVVVGRDRNGSPRRRSVFFACPALALAHSRALEQATCRVMTLVLAVLSCARAWATAGVALTEVGAIESPLGLGTPGGMDMWLGALTERLAGSNPAASTPVPAADVMLVTTGSLIALHIGAWALRCCVRSSAPGQSPRRKVLRSRRVGLSLIHI